ncbi:MAG: hypothetical protein L0Z62_43295 [Gemmataceae bacterium]|nr:hypothetical protein [Gemmataceae bacterium]
MYEHKNRSDILQQPLTVGDAHEPENVTSSFDPTGLERPTPVSTPAGPDPFDIDSLRLSQDFAASIGVKKALLSVPVRKPDKSWFVRVHPYPAYRLQTAVIELKEDRETYLVAPALWPDLATEATFSPRALFTAVNRQGVLFLWPIRLPGPDGRVDEWSRTALEAANLATQSWVRVAANMALGAYDVFQATGPLPEPEWPDTPFKELLRTAFKERYISDLNHPVLRRLRGEV